MDIIQSALNRGHGALSEYQSKKLLAAYGVPVTREGLAGSDDEAAGLARELGYPVALKACSPLLMHKTEAGAVELGVGDEAALRRAYGRIVDSAGVELEGVLVQEMVKGPRELVMGLSRDAGFGLSVMLGLGGVLTEIINDTVFRVAPVGRLDALDMVDELESRAIFDPFRGQKKADLEAICLTISALGRIGLERGEVTEIDLNPVIIDPEGSVKAVDALVVLGK